MTNTGGAPINVEDSFGASATRILDWPFKGGRNRSVLQYGTGAAFDFRSIGRVATATDPNAVHGSAFGVQMESWR